MTHPCRRLGDLAPISQTHALRRILIVFIAILSRTIVDEREANSTHIIQRRVARTAGFTFSGINGVKWLVLKSMHDTRVSFSLQVALWRARLLDASRTPQLYNTVFHAQEQWLSLAT
jgi:hypothetical protein